jgi:hypothetical protein
MNVDNQSSLFPRLDSKFDDSEVEAMEAGNATRQLKRTDKESLGTCASYE